MKRKILLISILVNLFSIQAYGTEQIPDLLIIEKDTFYLFYTFPIEDLNLEIKKNPFISGKYTIHSTACWRGYQAIWKIKNNKLYLQNVKSCHSDSIFHYNSVIEYFRVNGYEPNIENGKILADWFTSDLIRYDGPYFVDCKICLMGSDKLMNNEKVYYSIINGEIKEND